MFGSAPACYRKGSDEAYFAYIGHLSATTELRPERTSKPEQEYTLGVHEGRPGFLPAAALPERALAPSWSA